MLRLALPGLLPISLPLRRVGHPGPEHLSSRSLRVGAPAEASQVLLWEPVADREGMDVERSWVVKGASFPNG